MRHDDVLIYIGQLRYGEKFELFHGFSAGGSSIGPFVISIGYINHTNEVLKRLLKYFNLNDFIG